METQAWCSIAADKGHVFGYWGRQLFWLTVWSKRISRAALQGLADEIRARQTPEQTARESNHAFVAAPFEDVTRIRANQMPGEIEIYYQPLGLDEQRVVLTPPRADCLRLAATLAERISPHRQCAARSVSTGWSIADPVGVLIMGGLLCAGLYYKALDVEAGHPYSGSRRSAALGLLVSAAARLGSRGALVLGAAFVTFCLIWILRRLTHRPAAVEYNFRS
jgi:hypothetical protein